MRFYISTEVLGAAKIKHMLKCVALSSVLCKVTLNKATKWQIFRCAIVQFFCHPANKEKINFVANSYQKIFQILKFQYLTTLYLSVSPIIF